MERSRAEDAELVERLRAGDEAAFAALVDELTPALMPTSTAGTSE